MQHRESHTDLAGLLAHSLLATLGVVVLPTVIVLALVSLGLPDPQLLLATALGLAISCGVAAIGASLWIKRPESIEVAFGELMLWRYLRRKRAEKKVVVGAKRLGLVPDATEPVVEPERRLAVLQDLADALEAKDPYTHGHSRRVERHVYRTALAMHLGAEDIENLRLAAALHDVGKIQVPSAILRKPDKLTEDEFALVRQHSEIGASMVDPNGVPSITLAVRHHHESWNGAGYPAGLSGERIPLFARIIAVADAFDAMTSARPYKVARSRTEAVDALRASSGVQFDAEVVEAFISTLPSVLPAAGALLIFATPARAARRVLGWVQSTTGGGLAGAAGAVGAAVLVGTVGITNLPGSQAKATSPQVAAPQAIDGALPAAEPIVVEEDLSSDGDEITTADDLPSRAGSSGVATKGRSSVGAGSEAETTTGPGDAAAAEAGQDGSGAQSNADPVADGEMKPDAQTEPQPANEPEPKPANEPEPGPANDPEPDPEPKPKPSKEPKPKPSKAPPDPQPDKGKDCSQDGKGNGSGTHCG